MSHERPEMTGSQVVHVREGSEEAFEDLFKVLNKPRDDQAKPLSMRNLPKSFFQQPDSQAMFMDNDMSGYNNPSNTVSAHSRAHSSPASLQQTLSAAPQLPPQHMRQHSYDLVTEDQPLPPGWDIAKTTHGQSHLSQTTTWQDPRKSVSTNNLNKQQQQQQSGQPSPGPGSPSQSQQTIESTPLPQGWERAYTTEGEVYYINHMSRTTSWFHPSIPPQLQRPGMRLQQMTGGVPRPQQPMPGPRTLTPEERQRQLKLQHLQQEKERLKQRQDEIARQEMMIRSGNAEAAAAAAAAAAAQQQQSQPHSQKIPQATEMTSITDPFLGQTSGTELHSRHDSSDSGLGGMGTSCILPRTPEDFLTPDDMETQDGGPKLNTGQGEFGNVDMAALCSGDGGGEAMNMDSDDLVPSLHEELGNDLLKEVETVLNNKTMDNLLTWL